MLGATLGFLTASLVHILPHLEVMLFLVALGLSFIAYQTVQEGKHWYLWVQGAVAFPLVAVTDGPSVTDELALNRVAGIVIGAVVGCLVYVIPWPALDHGTAHGKIQHSN